MNRRGFIKLSSLLCVQTAGIVPFDALSSQINKDSSSREVFSGIGDGVSDNTSALKEFLSSKSGDMLIPAGKYIISGTININFKKSVNIKCEQGAVFILANNVRKTLFIFSGGRDIDFKWVGGEIDGNFLGQGAEEISRSGRVNDVSHGLVVNSWRSATIKNLFIHDFMGHHINHSGNVNFIADNIHIQSHPSHVFPKGGARGDGITGASENVYINNIRGYSTDDFIAVYSGIKWLPEQGDINTTQVKKIFITNITSIPLTVGGGTNHTWNAVSVSSSNGFTINEVNIENVTGIYQNRGVGVISEFYGGGTHGEIINVHISDIVCSVVGGSNNIYTHAPIIIGDSTYTHLSDVHNKKHCFSMFGSVTIENCNLSISDGVKSAIIIGNISIDDIRFNNVIVSSSQKNGCSAVILLGAMEIGLLKYKNVSFDCSKCNSFSVFKFAIDNSKPIKVIGNSPSESPSFFSFDKTYFNKIIFSN